MDFKRLGMFVLAVLAVAALAVGCGEESEEDKVKDTVDTFASAAHLGNGNKACPLLSPEAQKRLQETAQAANAETLDSCNKVIKAAGPGVGSANIDIERVTVNGDTAAVVTRNSLDYRLAKTGDKWIITQIVGA